MLKKIININLILILTLKQVMLSLQVKYENQIRNNKSNKKPRLGSPQTKNIAKMKLIQEVQHEAQKAKNTLKMLKINKNSKYSQHNFVQLAKSHQLNSQRVPKNFYPQFSKRLSISSTKCVEKPQLTIQSFEIIKFLGEGGTGQVYLVKEKITGFLLAIKKISKKFIKQKMLEKHIVRQIKALLAISHPNINDTYGIFSDQDFIYIMLQYMADGSLYEICKQQKFSQKEVRVYVKQIARALKYLHQRQITHRDLKLQNIFVCNGMAKVGDFGCIAEGSQLRTTQIGSPFYFCPEMLRQESYGNNIDIWCLGIITYELLFRFHPFYNQIIDMITKKTHSNQFPELTFPKKIKISSQARDFLLKTINKNSQQRISISEVLSHQFLQSKPNTENLLVSLTLSQ